MYLNDADEVIQTLIDDLGFWPSWAIPLVEANGRCVYCDEDLLSSRGAYAGAATDHLFPKSRYPKLEDNRRNWVLSCAACNSIKGSKVYDLEGSSDADQILSERRDEYIAIIRADIRDDAAKTFDTWYRLNKIFRWDLTE